MNAIQTYNEKMDIVIKHLNESQLRIPGTKMTSDITLGDYHQIIDNNNVVVISSPNINFDMENMRLTNQDGEHVIRISAGPDIISFKDFIKKIKTDDVVFFYPQVSCNTDNTLHVRYMTISSVKLKPYMDRLNAATRMKSIMNLNNSYEEIQSYVMSDDFKNDCATLKKSIDNV